jgi:hypothetical protein
MRAFLTCSAGSEGVYRSDKRKALPSRREDLSALSILRTKGRRPPWCACDRCFVPKNRCSGALTADFLTCKLDENYEDRLSNLFGEIVRAIEIPDDLAAKIAVALLESHRDIEKFHREAIEKLHTLYAAVQE